MKVLSLLLVIASIGAFVSLMNQAESNIHEIFAVAVGAFLAILARMAQAAGYHEDLMELERLKAAPKPDSPKGEVKPDSPKGEV